MRNVTKEIFLNGLVCPALGWVMRNEEISRTLTLGERFHIEQGREIGERARDLHPNGFLVKDRDMASASKKTESLMNDPGVSTVFEGAFFIDNFAARADMLRRKPDGWHLIEVKSGVIDKDEFIDDMAYTAMVMQRCGIDISNISLLLVSRDFRLGMKNEDLFVEIDHTDEVLERAELFRSFWKQIEETSGSAVKPELELRFECRKCQLFKECLGKGIANHIFDIPRLSKTRYDKFAELGIFCIEDIPDGFSLTEIQARMMRCVQTKNSFIGAGLKRELDSISWPAYYLDFETVGTAVPLYPDIAPYAHIPTQYSIHKCSGPGNVTDHFEYLADPGRDCRREIAETLVKHLKGRGSIIVYGNPEKIIISGLAELYPDLSGELHSLTARMKDLEGIIRKNFYHPDFHGSTSIKKTLPALVPELSYDGLEIAEGDSAMAAFAFLALGRYGGQEVETVRKNLLEYCKQDTMAMVNLHRQLAEYV